MRSWLHDIAENIRAAWYDLLLVVLATAAFIVGGCTARADEGEARAALALAKAKREREASSCLVDHNAAIAEARRTRRPLILWVGVTCGEHPNLRRQLNDAVHCHLREQHGDCTPRIVFEGADGKEWFVRAEKIGPETAKKIRAKWRR